MCLKGANSPNSDEIFNKFVPDDDSVEFRRMSDTGLLCHQTLLEYEVQPVNKLHDRQNKLNNTFINLMWF